MKYIFFAGIHGVGKGTICNHLLSFLKGWKHLSSGKLIERSSKNFNLENKKVASNKNNQDILLNEFECEKEDGMNILLDGHFCLLSDRNGKTFIDDVDIAVFKDLNLDGIICLVDDINLILDRLQNRDKTTFDIGLLKELQEREIKQAKKITQEMDLPLLIYDVSKDLKTDLLSFITSIK